MNPTCAVFRSCAFPTQSSTGVDSDRDVVEIARVVHGARVRELGKIPDDI